MLKILLKLLLAFALVAWLVSKGTLNLRLALQLKDYPWLLLQTLLLLILPFLTTAFRWKWILEIKTGNKLPIFPVMSLTWMGQFFSTILPGGVTGDIVKVVYATKLHSSLTKGYLLISAFIDRIFGLIGLLIVQGVFSLILFSELTALSPKIERLLYFNFALFVGVLIFVMTLFIKKNWQDSALVKLEQLPKVGKKLAEALRHFWLIGSNRKVFFKSLAITIVTHTVIIIAFYLLIKPFISQPLPLQYAFVFIPLGLISIMVPVSPMGLGVGHAMFQELFSYFHIMNGASLFNLFFLFEIFVNLLGGFFYIFRRD